LSEALGTIADQLVAEHRDGVNFHKFDGIGGLPEAYRVQDAYVAATIGDDAPAGYKIGLTSKRMQQMCGIDQPICGTIFSRRVFRSGARLSMASYGRLGLEFEICVRLGRDLVAGSEPFTPEQVGDAIDAVAAAIELVDDRHADYSALDINTLVADNSWNAGVVLGEFAPPPARLDLLEGIAYQDGAELARGRGADALGHRQRARQRQLGCRNSKRPARPRSRTRHARGAPADPRRSRLYTVERAILSAWR
jgi:2-oxo-3-hexenedioate decarboxylase/2-keto-4-pentenoate hydratase